MTFNPQAARVAPGRRRMSVPALIHDINSRPFSALPDGVKSPRELLAAVKRARAPIGISGPLIELIDFLFAFTEPQDWTETLRPIVWPSNRLIADQLGITVSAVQKRIQCGVTLGLFVMKDAPNGQRRGLRSKDGTLIMSESFGFDLAPLALRFQEFQHAAAAHRDAYRVRTGLRRKGFMLKTALLQAMEAAKAEGLWSSAWQEIEGTTEPLFQALRRAEQKEHLEAIIERLKELKTTSDLLIQSTHSSQHSQSMGGTNDVHNNDTANLIKINLSNNGFRKEVVETSHPLTPNIDPAHQLGDRISISVILTAVPELQALCDGFDLSWNTLADATSVLCDQYEISGQNWGRACQILGRHGAVLAFAIMAHHFSRGLVTSTGGYFHAMIERGIENKLDLVRAYHGMRSRVMKDKVRE